MTHPLRSLAVCALLCAVLLGGCATHDLPSSPQESNTVVASPAANAGPWQGRFSVKVWSKPVQAFSASFELQGSPDQGHLELTSVLGSVLARMHWDPNGAFLENASTSPPTPQQFDSVQTMARQALGVEIPVALFFGWVQGQPLQDAHWSADTREWRNGRISAKRHAEPQAEILILLDQ